MKTRAQRCSVLFFATILFGAARVAARRATPAMSTPSWRNAEPAAEAPSEPQVPIMMREFREIREAPNAPDGDMVPIEENRRAERQLVTPLRQTGKIVHRLTNKRPSTNTSVGALPN